MNSVVINHLNYTMGDRVILKNISSVINQGEFVVLTGHNGSGKSTLLNLIHTCKDKKIVDRTGKSLMVHQNINDNLFCDLTIFENFQLIGIKDRSTIEGLLIRFKSKPNLDTTVSLLSGGERQRLALYLRLMMKPQILLLDEFTSALDPEVSAELIEELCFLAKRDFITVLMITHAIDLVKNKKYTHWMMENGKLTVC